MGHIGTHLLTWLCTALLVLPPGWCCFVPVTLPVSVSSNEETPAPPQPDCCCCHETPATGPSTPQDGKGHKGEPTQPRQCCCAPHDTILSKHPQPAVDEVAAVAVSPVPVDRPAAPTTAAPVGGHPVFEAPPLQIVYCVWLC